MNTQAFILISVLCSLFGTTFKGVAWAGAHQASETQALTQTRHFLLSLGSEECETRSRAIFEYLPKLRTTPRQIFMDESASASAQVKSKLEKLLEVLERDENARKEFERLLKQWIAPALKAEGAEQLRLFDLAKSNLVSIAKSHSEAFYRRQAAVGTLEFFVDQYDDGDGQARRLGLPVVEWESTLTAFMTSEDQRLRSLVAGMLGQSSKFEKGHHLIPVLISSLRDSDLSVRISAQKALMHRTKQKFCIDPSDSPATREKGIRQWESWWKENANDGNEISREQAIDLAMLELRKAVADHKRFEVYVDEDNKLWHQQMNLYKETSKRSGQEEYRKYNSILEGKKYWTIFLLGRTLQGRHAKDDQFTAIIDKQSGKVLFFIPGG